MFWSSDKEMSSFIVRCLALILIILILGVFLWRKSFGDDIPILVRFEQIPEEGILFDYIIVGAGTAGSVVATELSRKSTATILLIEAGHKFGVVSKVPLLATLAQKTSHDWAFLSSPQRYSSKGLIEQKQSLPRGKGLGGSAQLNYLLHFDGNKEDFDNWNNFGATEWTYERMSKYLFEDSTSSSPSDRHCGLESTNGDFCHIADRTQHRENIWQVPGNYSKITDALEEARKELQQEFNIYRSQYSIKNGLRWGAFEAFLRPNFDQPNMRILSLTTAVKIEFKKFRAKCVSIKSLGDDSGSIKKICARKEIILSAGAFQTPQILQLSGIGPKKCLDAIGVKVLVDCPRVGQNLYDHLNMPLYVTINESATITAKKLLNFAEIWKYLTTGTGHYGNFGVMGHMTPKNYSFGVSIFGIGAIDEAAFMSLSNFKQEIFRSLFPFYHNSSQEGCVLLSTCLRPRSRGFVKVVSKDIDDLPVVDPRYLSLEQDMDCTIRAIRAAVKLMLSKPFRALKATIHWPKFKACSKFGPFSTDFLANNPSDEYLACIIRIAALSSHHPGGTCAIGDAEKGVVDQNLRVRGVSGLRVVDASVMPAPVSGTPNRILIGLSKRAADLILHG